MTEQEIEFVIKKKKLPVDWEYVLNYGFLIIPIIIFIVGIHNLIFQTMNFVAAIIFIIIGVIIFYFMLSKLIALPNFRLLELESDTNIQEIEDKLKPWDWKIQKSGYNYRLFRVHPSIFSNPYLVLLVQVDRKTFLVNTRSDGRHPFMISADREMVETIQDALNRQTPS